MFLILGLSRTLSVQFAFLLPIPVILTSFIFIDLYNKPQAIDLTVLFIGFLISALSGYLVVFLYIKTIEKIRLLPFLIYRLFLGAGLLLL